jgi:hypothetical protein
MFLSEGVNAILKSWCILINSVFMKLPIYPYNEEFNSVCPEKLKKMFPRCIAISDCTFIYHNLIPWFYEVYGATFTKNFWI